MLKRLSASFAIGLAVGVVGVMIFLAGPKDKGDIFEPARVGWSIFPILERRVEIRTNDNGQTVQVAVIRNRHGMYTLPLAAGLTGLILTAMARKLSWRKAH